MYFSICTNPPKLKSCQLISMLWQFENTELKGNSALENSQSQFKWGLCNSNYSLSTMPTSPRNNLPNPHSTPRWWQCQGLHFTGEKTEVLRGYGRDLRDFTTQVPHGRLPRQEAKTQGGGGSRPHLQVYSCSCRWPGRPPTTRLPTPRSYLKKGSGEREPR